MAINARDLFNRRKQRTRTILRRRGDRLRLTVFRSNKHIYAQVIDDRQGTTVAAASSVDKDLRAKGGSDADAASRVGKLIADRAIAAGIKEVVFDRGGYRFHGRIKALADAARENGLAF